jgi:peptidyl-prolyl cis-trans isomerase C
MLRLFKEPLIQFLVLGACIYGAYAVFGAADEDAGEYTIVVDEMRVQGFITAWQGRMNRAPTQQELDGMINQYIKEEILYREASAMGLGENDPITRRRLAQKLEFLTKDIARLKEPTEGELEQYFADNIDLYREPELITFMQVFFDPDKRNEATLPDAEAALVLLSKRGEPDGDVNDFGDRFMLQSYYPQKSELDIRRQFGAGFSGPVMQLEPGQWHGPVLSGYGVHLVYVYALLQAPEPVFADVQERVFEDWQMEQQEKFNADYFEGLKSRYDIVVETEQAGPDSKEESAVSAASAETEPAT